MGRHLHLPRRQRGAVAVMFGITLIVLLAAGGLAIDLGHLYVLKSELQNGADSAALAGAKEINLSAGGITKAVERAKKFASVNNYNFSTSLVLTDANIEFGSTPDGPWSSVSAATASPSNMTFIKVDTSSKSISTYLMGVVGLTSTSTSGVAVAGRFVVNVTPLGICALDATRATDRLAVGATAEFELLEWGFRRGLTYNLAQLGPVAGPADPMLINPVDSPPQACQPSNSSAAFTAPFLCQGNSALPSSMFAAYSNTGGSVGPVEKALNSRLDLYPGGTQCLASTSPPDTNIQYYFYDRLSGRGTWSYSKAVRAVGAGPTYTAGAEFTPADWPELYGTTLAATAIARAAYPLAGTPYSQTTPPWYAKPPVHAGVPDRRVMNLALVDCAGVGAGPMACKSLPVKGIGRFFLQEPVDLNGAPATRTINIEFAGMIEPVPNSEIKLYR